MMAWKSLSINKNRSQSPRGSFATRTKKRIGIFPIVLLLNLFFFSFSLSAQEQISSGKGKWRTITTNHFRIHYPENARHVARTVADVAESYYLQLKTQYRRTFRVIHVVIVTDNDTVNAYATPLGFDQIVLFVNNPQVGPSGGSGWSYYDEWVRELFLHEFIHILTTGYRESVFRQILYYVLGVTPNAISPRGMSEGIAVYEESKGGHGRINDPVTQMIFRKAVETNTFPDPGEMMNGSHRWPMGSIYYIYGGAYNAYLARNFGENAIARYWRGRIFPFYLDGAMLSTGLPRYLLTYGKFRGRVEKFFREQIQTIKSGGITKTSRLTSSGGFKSHLTLEGGAPIYFRSRTNGIPGIYSVEPESKTSVENRIRRAYAVSGLAAEGGRRVFSEDYFSYPDLGLRYELYDGNSLMFDRMLPGRSAAFPSLSRNGKILHFVERDANRKTLKWAILDDKGGIEKSGDILTVPSEGILQYTATSENGDTVAALVRTGPVGRGEMVLCNLSGEANGADRSYSCHRKLEADAAMIHLRYGGDGRIYFSADIDRIFSIYSFEPQTGDVQRHTRTTGGHFYPNPAENKFYILEYFENGYDLSRVEKDNILHEKAGGFNVIDEPLTSVYEREATTAQKSNYIHDRPYGGIAALQPYFSGIVNIGYLPGYSWFVLGGVARDPLERHYLTAIAGISSNGPEAYFQYDYTRFSLTGGAYYFTNYFGKRKPCFFEGKGLYEILLCDEVDPKSEESSGYLTYTAMGRYMSASSLFGVIHMKNRDADRYAGIRFDHKDYNLTGPRFSIVMGNTHQYPRSISPEHGWRFFASADYFLPAYSFVSDGAGHYERIEFGQANGGLSLYLPSFFPNHVNVLSASGFSFFGPDRDEQKVSLAMFVRGQDVNFAPTNRAAVAFTYEYRFPIIWLSRAFSESFASFMFRQIDLALFYEGGYSFYKQASAGEWRNGYGLRLNMGAYLWFLPAPFEFTLSVARGTGDSGETMIGLSFTIGASLGGVNEGVHREKLSAIPHRTNGFLRPEDRIIGRLNSVDYL